MKIKQLAVALVLMLGTTAGVVLISSPAQAVFNTCPPGDVCSFDLSNGGGFRYDFGTNVFGGCVNNGRHAYSTSFANRRIGTKVKFYSGSNCFLPGEGFVSNYVYYGQNIDFTGGALDNQVYSMWWVNA